LVETHGCDLNSLDDTKDTPLCHAFRYCDPKNDFSVLSYLISQNSVTFEVKGRYGCNVLHKDCSPIFVNSHPPFVEDKLLAENDTFWSKIAEIIIQRCIQGVFDGIVH
jgi:hypothetical protein